MVIKFRNTHFTSTAMFRSGRSNFNIYINYIKIFILIKKILILDKLTSRTFIIFSIYYIIIIMIIFFYLLLKIFFSNFSWSCFTCHIIWIKCKITKNNCYDFMIWSYLWIVIKMLRKSCIPINTKTSWGN